MARHAVRVVSVVSVSLTGFLAACGDDDDEGNVFSNEELSIFEAIPASIEVDADKVELGRKLYHDTGLSGDNTVSCATCHAVATGGDDDLPTSKGIAGKIGPINAPTVLNAVFNPVQFWDGREPTLEAQAAGPVQNPAEMGSDWGKVFAYLSQSKTYEGLFEAVFGSPLTSDNTADYTTKAIAEFERTLITPNAPFDGLLRGDDNALNVKERRGLRAFLDAKCQTCHAGKLLGGDFAMMNADYFTDRGGEITDADRGRLVFSKKEEDLHVFKVPTLRNIDLTAPYMHDGTQTTLSDVVRVMVKYQSSMVLTDEQVNDVVAFLKTLTGEIPTINVEP